MLTRRFAPAVALALGTAFLVIPATTPTAHAEDSLYDRVEGSARGLADLGSGEGMAGSLPNYDPQGFYASLPDTVHGHPGEIIKTQPSNFALGLPLLDWTDSDATRVAYVSTNAKGETMPMTGTVFTSSAPWKGQGPRPLLTVAPGTQGSGDVCSPGKLTVWGVEYEAAPVAAALARGWNVALTDLAGLGTPTQHTYMNRADQANATLDMARAAIALDKSSITKDSPVATWGYSQGGGASAAAMEMAPTYAPEVNLVAGYAGGIPADLGITAKGIDNMPLAAAMGYVMNGMLERHPEMREALMAQMNDKGAQLLEETKDECLTDSLLRHSFQDSRELTKNGKSISELMELEPFKSWIAEQKIGNRPPKVPVYVGHGTQDDTIPVEQSRQLARQWCTGGTKVFYQEHDLPSVGPLVDHMAPMFTHLMPALDWLEKVVNGSEYPLSDCGSLPTGDEPTGFEGNGSTRGSLETGLETSQDGIPGSRDGLAEGSHDPHLRH